MITRQVNKAEERLLFYKREKREDKLAAFILFMKDICNTNLYPSQILSAYQYFMNDKTMDVKPPRGGKTLLKQGVNLYEEATNPFEDHRIYVPKYDQGKDALSYQYNWIEASPVLTAYLRKRGGKKQLSSVNYEFVNGSNSKIYGIMGEIEGHNVTIMDIEEFDDWKWEKFTDDVMRRGGAKNRNGLPTRVRISGTIMGQENIYKILSDPNYKKMFANCMYAGENNPFDLKPDTPMDVYTLLKFGVLDPEFVEFQKTMMSPDEWARSMLLRFTESTNFIWSVYFRSLIKKAMEWNLQAEPYKKGGTYKSSGIVGFGFDCGSAGQRKHSSKYSLQLYEQVGFYRRWLNSFEWSPKVDESKLQNDLIDIFGYYRPAGGFGDALGHRLISSVNDKAYYNGLTNINRENFPENTPANWDKWWFSPINNSGKVKYLFYSSLKHGIHNATCFYPYYKIGDMREEALQFQKLKRSILSIREEQNQSSFPSYFSIDNEIGDDDADAAGMANLWIDTRAKAPLNMDLIKVLGKKTVTSDLQIDSILGEINIDRGGYEEL